MQSVEQLTDGILYRLSLDMQVRALAERLVGVSSAANGNGSVRANGIATAETLVDLWAHKVIRGL